MKIGWRNVLGIALSIGLLYWAFHAVDFGRVVQHLRNANLYYFAGATIAGTAIFPLRARRSPRASTRCTWRWCRSWRS